MANYRETTRRRVLTTSNLLSLPVALACACAAAAAGAQTAPTVNSQDAQLAAGAQTKDAPGSAPARSGTQPVLASSTPQLEDIVVTAEKVERSAQRTAIPLQTVTNDQLVTLGITDAVGLNRVVPDLIVSPQFGGDTFFVRGVGSDNASPLGNEGVAFDVNGVYFSRPYGQSLALFDVARVEVLKGPQGTLYGRDATGGVVNVISRRPSLAGYDGDLQIEFGDYNQIRTEGAINAPLSEKVAVRLAFQINKHSGYLTDGYDDARSEAGRLSLLWEPSSRFRLNLTSSVMHENPRGQELLPYGNNTITNIQTPSGPFSLGQPYNTNQFLDPGNPWLGASSGLISAYYRKIAPAVFNFGGADGFPLFSPFIPNGDGRLRHTIWYVSPEIESDLGFAKLTVVPTYLANHINDFLFTGTLPQTTRFDTSQGSVEVRLNGKAGPLSWIAGAFWQKENVAYHLRADFIAGAQIYSDLPDVTDETVAGFGQATYEIIRGLRLQGGIRYTYDHKSEKGADSTTTTVDPLNFFDVGGYLVSPATGSVDFRHVTYRGGIEWDASAKSLLYANYATGFHSGGLEPGASVGPNPTTYAPETLSAYTLGSKNRFFNNRLQLNLELFYWLYHSLQVQALGGLNGGGNSSIQGEKVFNAGKAHIDGVEVDANLLLTGNDLLSANVVYTNAVYDSFGYVDLLNGPVNLTGKKIPYVAPISASLSYTHTFHLSNGGSVDASVHTRIQDRATLSYNPSPDPTTISPGYTRTDFNVTYTAPNDRWSVTGYVRNIEGSADLDTVFGNSTGPGVGLTPTNTFTPEVSIQAPRTFGFIVRYKFGAGR